MRLIRDFTQMDTATLCRGLRSFKRTVIGLPVLFAIIPTLGIVALRPAQLWWLIPVYFGGILFVTGLIGTAYGRNVREIERRMDKTFERGAGR
jgi:hypothetical protein